MTFVFDPETMVDGPKAHGHVIVAPDITTVPISACFHLRFLTVISDESFSRIKRILSRFVHLKDLEKLLTLCLVPDQYLNPVGIVPYFKAVTPVCANIALDDPFDGIIAGRDPF